ncbi:nuclear transport factor 2 family protein [Shimia sp. SDUM112013]|uniref:nuclear transport factor 2 family protein n=1 Tax=Shimia sp. SDUM112013 TaxID=3136160 RepID=UPI0032EB78B1
MSETHPAITVLGQFDPSDIEASAHLFTEDAVWHYSNPNLPELEGDYVGGAGIGAFFATLARKTHGTFRIEPISVTPVGAELVVVQARNTLTLDARNVTVDVVVVWRIVAGRITEVWDIVPGQPTEVHNARD